MKVDSGLCQPAGTPISTRIRWRLGVTFFVVVDIETEVLRPVHVGVERRIALLTDVQPAFNTLTVIFSSAHATRYARAAFGHLHDRDSLNLRFVRENLRKSVERPPVKVEIAVPTPILRFTVLALAHAFQVTDVNAANTFLDTPFNDVPGEAVEEVGAALRPLVVQASSTFTIRVVAFSGK